MTDQTAPAATNHDRRLAHSWAETVKAHPECWGQRQLAAARVILDTVPAPAPPTLADMTPEEGRACRWMQADTETWGRVVILSPYANGGLSVLLDQSGDVLYKAPALVTPRPDLPRMVWPSDQKAEDAPALPGGWRLAEHQTRGPVIVTRPEPDDAGDAAVVCPAPDVGIRADVFWCKPAELTYLDTDQETDQ